MANRKEDDFFAGIEQVDVWAAGNKSRLPLFYRDARACIAVFPAGLPALKRLLPDPRFTQAQVLPGIGAVALACFEYRDTDVGPYNEFALGILLNNPHIVPLPGYNILRQLAQFNFYPYIFRLPVTTEAALRWGIDYSGFPKFLASIEFSDTGDWLGCELKEREELICRLKVRKIAAPMHRLIKFFIRLYQFRQPQSTEFKMNARALGISLNPFDAELVIGSMHPVARELSRVMLMKKPLMCFFVPSAQLILYGPENLSFPLVNYLFQQGMRIPLDRIREEPEKKDRKALKEKKKEHKERKA